MRYLNSKLAVAILLLGTISCALVDQAVAGETVSHEELLRENMAKWDASGIVEYEFDIKLSCFCGTSDITKPLHLVIFGSTATITEIESGRVITEEEIRDRLIGQIPKLFYMIPKILAEEPAYFRVDYDEEFGFPRIIAIDVTANGSDDELGVTVSNFRVLRSQAISSE